MLKVRLPLSRLIAQALSCSRGSHSPSRGRARWRDGAWRSSCRNCGATMTRLGKGGWALDEN